MRSDLKIRDGVVNCPARGETSVGECRDCIDFKRVEGSEVVCNASLGLMSGDWWGKVILAGSSPVLVRRDR